MFLRLQEYRKIGAGGWRVDYIIALNSLLSLFIKESQLLPVAMHFR